MGDIKVITVLGAGDMGHGIAELAALKGLTVRVRDVKQDILDKAKEKVRWSLSKLAEKQTVTKDAADAAMARLTFTTDLAAACEGSQFIIEAVPENLELKRKVFAEVEKVAPPEAILASNTSTMRITEIAQGLKHPSRLVGMHFFNPVLLMDLIEIIPSDVTRADVVETTKAVSKTLGKTVVVCRKDTPGFITSRLVGVWVGAGVAAYEHKLAGMEEIDSAMKFRAAFPMGPFELADYTGNDIGFHAGNYIASHLGASYKPPRALADLVAKGKLGKKTGSGFYEWDGNRMKTNLSQELAKGFDPVWILAITANEAAKIVGEGVGTAGEIDLAMRNGTAFPKGPLEWADAVGLDVVLKTVADAKEKTGEAFLEPAKKLVDLVAQGHLGKKTGKGFYDYAPAPVGAPASAASPASPSASYETLLVEDDAAAMVRTITLNRPHRLNALNDVLVSELARAIEAADADESVRCILITGSTEKAFCVGADLMEGVTPLVAVESARRAHKTFAAIENCGKPVVAAINGYAFGGGLEVALACDFRVAAKRAKLALPEVTLGLLPAAGGTQRLPKLIGLSRAKEFVLLGARWDADECLRTGLVHRVFENETFAMESHAFASELAKRAPIAVRFAKRLLNSAPTTDNATGADGEVTAFGVLAGTEDVLEGVGAMFMKRPPEFKGK